MFRKAIIFVLMGLAPALSFAANQGGNSDETLAKFKPQKIYAKPQNVSAYIDTQYYRKPSNAEFYVGIMGGASYFDISRKKENLTSPSTQTTSNNDFGVDGGAILGFGKLFADRELYLGLEVMGFLSDHSVNLIAANSSAQQANLKVSIKNNLSIRLLPGLVFSKNVRLYGIVGIGISQFKASVNGTGIGSQPPTQILKINSFSKTIISYNLGLAMDIYLTHNISIRPEYDFIGFQNPRENFTDTSLGTVNFKNTFDPYMHRVSLGLVLHFG